MEGAFGKLIPIILFLGVIALIAGTTGIMVSEFGETMDTCYNSSFTYNTSRGVCHNTSSMTGTVPAGCCGYDGKNLSNQYYTKFAGMDGLTTVGEQQPTIAIIAVMVIIILALASILGYVGLSKMR